MKTKIKVIVICLLALLCHMEINAQNKTFTLEDLNFGGNNYRNMVPKNQYYTWWGDELIRQDSEQCFYVNKKTGKEKTLFTQKQINNW